MTEGNIVEEWLRSFNLNQYAESFLDNGYDDLEICKQIGEDDLDAIGVTDDLHRQQILRAVRELLEQGGSAVYFTVEEQRKSTVDSDVFYDGSSPNYLSTMHPVTSIKPRLVSSKVTTEVSGSYGCCGGAFVSVHGCASSRISHEYEENKLGFIKLPKIQLKKMIRDKLIREGIRLGAQPYSNT
ncbi:sterile alpha motif domain-containing protein 5-like, partial [Limulus polyphemus]|uniref:Sterile alpha motif domain-containing protein 5-like n=1 Tax=Limulus polyphemus TaxID=6850 RepID=A0ABM1C0T7_LIMPO